jgi:hypothetical protein
MPPEEAAYEPILIIGKGANQLQATTSIGWIGSGPIQDLVHQCAGRRSTANIVKSPSSSGTSVAR